MKRYQYLILGAGPAGLSFAHRLQKNGCDDFLIIEKNLNAGGLCRSENVDGTPMDVGGGHFLDVRRPEVCDFIFGFLPKSEWELFSRNSCIYLNNDVVVNHPIEANIWQMSETIQKEFLNSIASAGCNNGQEMPIEFVNWIQWKLGKRISDDYMLPYNRKIYGENLNALGTYWLEKLPNVSYEDTIRSIQDRRQYGSQPGHAVFYYPKKYGMGEVWNRIATFMESHIIYDSCIKILDIMNKKVSCSNEQVYCADNIIVTIPWTDIEIIGIDDDIQAKIGNLMHSSIVTEYHDEASEIVDKTDTYFPGVQWIYIPNLDVTYHRILVRKNFLLGSKGYWTETNLNRHDKVITDKPYFMNQYAYPLNTIGKNEVIKQVLNCMENHNIWGLGRWGEWQHYNMDVTIERAFILADSLEGR